MRTKPWLAKPPKTIILLSNVQQREERKIMEEAEKKMTVQKDSESESDTSVKN